MRKFAIVVAIQFFLSGLALGQLSEGGTPPSFGLSKSKTSEDFNKLVLPKLHTKRLLRQDQKLQSQRLPYSKYEEVSIDLKKEGTITQTAGGTIWRYQIESKNGYAIGLIFSQYNIPKGAKLYVYSANQKIIYGAFTSQNNKSSKVFAIADLPSQQIIIEYFEPTSPKFLGELVIGKIGQVYRDMEEMMVQEAELIEITCPEGDNYQLAKHAVAKISFEEDGRGYQCSGSLINNTRNDGTPYFLTAAHCLSTQPSATTVIARFNYERIDCNSGLPGNQTLSGSSLKATYASTDMTLLLLEEDPPPEYQPFFPGWNAEDDTLLGMGYSIHHPNGGLKKLSVDFKEVESFPFAIDWNDGATSNPNSHWITYWDLGSTRIGSSGGPLFDQNGRIVGQLHGSDELNTYSLYGKVSQSWYGSNSIELDRLSPFLDPDNSGELVLDGYIPDDNFVEAIPSSEYETVCTGTPIQLIDKSIFSPSGWSWSFIPSTVEFLEGTTANSQNPVVAFQDDNTYNVILTATNDTSSDSRTRSAYITSSSDIKPQINSYPVDKIYYCEFDSTMLNGAGADTFQWNVILGSEYILFDSASLNLDHLVIWRNDTLHVDSSFVVVFELTGSMGTCSTTVTDSISFYLPFNDHIQNAYPLQEGDNGPFHNYCATVEEGEKSPDAGNCNSQKTWCECSGKPTLLDNTVWFSFIAPESGVVSIDAPGFDTQIALFEADSAKYIFGDVDSLYSLIAANDDYFGEEQDYSALINAAEVIPGKKYWLQVDGSACGAQGEFNIVLMNKAYEPEPTAAITAETASSNDIQVLPNPAREFITVRNIPVKETIIVSLINQEGRIVYMESLSSADGNLHIRPNSELASGLYILKLKTEDNSYNHESKVIIEK